MLIRSRWVTFHQQLTLQPYNRGYCGRRDYDLLSWKPRVVRGSPFNGWDMSEYSHTCFIYYLDLSFLISTSPVHSSSFVPYLLSAFPSRKEAGDVWRFTPPPPPTTTIWNLMPVVWFPFPISCLVFLPSHLSLSVLSFFLLMVHSPAFFSFSFFFFFLQKILFLCGFTS